MSNSILIALFVFFYTVPRLLSQAQGADGFAATSTHGQQAEHFHEVHCSRERSRAAWKIIEEYLMPFMEKEKYQISRNCRLHLDNDMFRDQEQHKIHVDTNEWRCDYCKKSFYAEKYIDKHFENRHDNLLNVNGRKCLADLCSALHCDHVMNYQPQKTKCNPGAAVRNRHMCESLADSCFPISDGPSASRLHEFFLHQFCDAHTCSSGKRPFSKGGKKRTSVSYIIISILTLMLLLLFYGFFFMYQRGLKRGTHDLRRISKTGRKKKLPLGMQSCHISHDSKEPILQPHFESHYLPTVLPFHLFLAAYSTLTMAILSSFTLQHNPWSFQGCRKFIL